MPRRRGGAKSTSRSPELSKQATSPETRLRRPTRGASLTPSKPTRRHPTEALHMTTRAAAGAASTADTDSAANSIASGDSRRSSFDDVPPAIEEEAEIDIDHHHPTNGTQESAEVNHSQPKAPDSMQLDATELQASQPSSQDSQETGRSNKRKRSFIAEEYAEDEPHTNGFIGNATQDDGDDTPANGDPPTAHAPPRKRQFKGKGRGRTALSTQTSFAARTEASATPASGFSPDKDAADQQSENLEAEGDRPVKQAKRLPGRRRAPNSNPYVEADLRRQLQLKTAYRAVVKVLKPILAELADRTINDVEDDPTAHQESDQYEVVKAALDKQLAERLAYLNRRYNLTKELIERRDTAETDIAKSEFQHVFKNFQEDYIMHCQHQLLSIARDADRQEQDGYGTEDEDGIVPRRRGMQYKWRPTGFLDPAYDSRSRFFIETEKLWDRYASREASKKKRSEFLQENVEDFDETTVNNTREFSTFDADRRDYAIAVFNASTLAHAAHAVETQELPQYVKPIPNEDATGLQLLAAAIDSIPSHIESNASRLESDEPRATPTPKVGRGRGKRASAKSTPVKAHGRSRAASPAEASSAVSAGEAAMSLDSEREEEAHPKAAEPQPAINEPQTNGQREIIPEPEPSKPYLNRITDLLNKEEDIPPSIIATPSTEIPAPLAPAILQPLTLSAKATPEPRTSEPVPESHAATTSIMKQEEQPAPLQTPIIAPEEKPHGEPADRTRSQFWSTVNTRATEAPPPEKTPLERIRQILNPSNYPRSPDATTASVGTPDRSSEKREMAPPTARASVSRDDVSSRRSSGATSIISQSASAPPQALRSPVEAPPSKRASTRDPGLEQRQNRWRAAVPPQHGPTPPFGHSRSNSANPPASAFGKPHDWSMREAPARGHPPPSTAPPLPSYHTYTPPYDTRAPPPGSYGPPPGSQTPSGPPYGQAPPQPSPFLAAIPGIRPSYPHAPSGPPGPPIYQSIYPPPSTGYPPHPAGYGQLPPAPPQVPPPQPPHYAGPQYGGQPILPATLDRRASGQQPGAPPAYGAPPPGGHPPAFSQQQQQQQFGEHHAMRGHEGSRGGGRGGKRRWRNHPAGTEFRPYTGPKRH